MNYLALFVAMLIFTQQPSKAPKSERTPKPNSANVTNQSHGTQKQQEPAPSSAPTGQATNPQVGSNDKLEPVSQGDQTSKADSDAHKEDLQIQRKLVWFTGALAGIGLLQVGVTLLQWLVYRRQAVIMSRQAETTIDTERAWIVASPVDRSPQIGFLPDANATNLERHLVGVNQRNVASFSFKNTGRTPARLVHTIILYRIVDKREDIPSEPQFRAEDITLLNDTILAPGDTVEFVQFLEPSPILTQAQSSAVHRQEAFLYAYGIMVYRDAYGRQRETRFGYLYHFPLGLDPRQSGLRRELMPPGYNGAT